MTAAMALALAALGGWWVTAPRTRFRFGAARASWGRAVGAAVWAALDRQLSAPIRQATAAIGWPPSRLVGLTALFGALFVLVALVAVGAWGLVALPVALALGWRLAGHLARTQYRVWQRQMLGELPALLAVLRVHLDLGRTVPDALRAALPSVRDPLRRELARTLSDMALAPARGSDAAGRPAEARHALTRLAQRVDRIEFRAFADTVVQAWDARLAGAALQPLQALLRTLRERQAEETAARLDMVMSAAPGFAVFGIVVWLIGGFLLHSLAGGGLF